MASLSQSATPTDLRVRPRLVLLIGQSFWFGVTLAFLIITANALFLTDFGADKLPWSYIAVALLGTVVSSGLARLQQRWSLPLLTTAFTIGMAVLFLLCWLAIAVADLRWVSFILIVVFSLYIPIGFVFIGGQAGRLFDLRQVKRMFPQVVMGFGAGFMVGGFLGAPLVTLLGSAEDLLIAATATTLLMLAAIGMTVRRFHAELRGVPASTGEQKRLPLHKLLTRRYILLIFIYQMLSAVATQLIDFVMFSQAAARYTESDSLARFLSNYTAVLNLADILFLAFLAGLLLSRFGLRFGLTANPGGVALLVIATLVSGALQGFGSLLFFGLVLALRITDIVLTDGTTRGSLNTAYQALPQNERLATQTGVEGIGVPVALGLTGVILLLVNAIDGVTVVHLIILILLVTVGWTVAGTLVYRDYSTNLLRIMRHRHLDMSQLSLEDDASLSVVERFLDSNDPMEVRLGLDMLLQTEHPSTESHLLRLAGWPQPAVQRVALEVIETRRIRAAASLIRNELLSESQDPQVLAAALTALAALEEAEAVPSLASYVDHSSDLVRAAALVGLIAYCDDEGGQAASRRIEQMVQSSDPGERALVARVVGGVGRPRFYQPLVPLLGDADKCVRQAALVAAGQVGRPELLPQVINALSSADTRSYAVSALEAYGVLVLPLISEALAETDQASHETCIRLLRICRRMESGKVIEALRPFMRHPDREVGLQVLNTLQAVGYHAAESHRAEVEQLLIEDATHARRILLAKKALGAHGEAQMLQRALDNEYELTRRRIFLLLALVYDADALLQAQRQLRHNDAGKRAVALEMLEVTLNAKHRDIVMPLAFSSSADQQLAQLTEKLQLEVPACIDQLRQLIGDPQNLWASPWLRACACYYAGLWQLTELHNEVLAACNDADENVRESAEWATGVLASTKES